jgi:hypothetical protein
MTTQNRYESLAREHMERYLPSRYAQINDPDRYFSDLDDQIADRIRELVPTLAGEAPAGEGWLETVGRMNMARLAATEAVYAELVYLTPEADPDTEADPEWEGIGFPFYVDHLDDDQLT